jgi:hypothetical protein
MSRLERLAPLSAFVAVILVFIGAVLTGETPSGDDSAQEVVDFYADKETEVWVGSILVTLAALALVWFAASLRAHIREREGGSGRVSTLPFAGGILIAVGITIFAGIEVSAAEVVDDVPPASMQALNALDNGMFFTLALGFMVMYLSLAVAILRFGVFPRWLGWVSVVLAVLSLTPLFFIPILLAVIYFPLLGWLIYQEQGRAPSPR